MIIIVIMMVMAKNNDDDDDYYDDDDNDDDDDDGDYDHDDYGGDDGDDDDDDDDGGDELKWLYITASNLRYPSNQNNMFSCLVYIPIWQRINTYTFHFEREEHSFTSNLNVHNGTMVLNQNRFLQKHNKLYFLRGIHTNCILSDVYSDILSGILSGILSDMSSAILPDILSGILSGILSFHIISI